MGTGMGLEVGGGVVGGSTVVQTGVGATASMGVGDMVFGSGCGVGVESRVQAPVTARNAAARTKAAISTERHLDDFLLGIGKLFPQLG